MRLSRYVKQFVIFIVADPERGGAHQMSKGALGKNSQPQIRPDEDKGESTGAVREALPHNP